MPVPALTVDATGVHAPSYAEVLQGLIDDYKGIYGEDIELDASTQDYEFLAICALAIHNANMSAVAAHAGFKPSFAQGANLAALVKLNGIRRQAPTHSTAELTITGVANTPINNGVARDTAGKLWDLPALVTIGAMGTVVATGTAREEGAIAAGPGTITGIYTPTRGWQTVNNIAAATLGAPVESDAALRRRQAISVSFPGTTVLEATSAAVGNVDGVTRFFVYENDTGVTDSNGIPAHSIAAVVQGGDGQDIAEAIASRKPPGIQTYGSSDRVVTDSRGVPSTINYSVLDEVEIDVEITIQPFLGYVSTTAALIQAAIGEFLNSLEIGEDSYLGRLYSPANLSGAAAVAATGLTQAQLDELSNTYTVTLIRQRKGADPFAAADIALAFDEAAAMGDPENDVTMIVL